MPLQGLYTVSEAATILSLTPGAIRNAIKRGALRVDAQVPGRNFISESEVERYRTEVQGKQGWAARKALDYRPNQQHIEAQRRWRRRKQAAKSLNEGTPRAINSDLNRED